MRDKYDKTDKYTDYSDYENMKKRKGLTGRNFKQGIYTSLIAVFVVVIVIFANLFVGQMNLKVDLTREEVYTLTDKTKDMVAKLEDEIQIYYLVQKDYEYEVLKNIVEQYDKLPNVSTEWKDPELYPQFASQYTKEPLEGNDIIVVNKTTGKSKFVPFHYMYITDYQIDADTREQYLAEILDVEGQITSAIQYVTTAKNTKMYVVSAHGERQLEEEILDLINKANVEVTGLDVVTQNVMPEDCDILFINGPLKDISDDELKMYKEYLDNGGKAILTVAFSREDLSNYYELLEYYGIEASKAIVYEENGNFVMDYPAYIASYLATVTDEISSNFTFDNFVIMPMSTTLKVKDDSQLRDTLEIKEIVKSSEGSYGKITPESDVIEKEDVDIDGPFSLVVQASDTYKDKSSKVAVYATNYFTVTDFNNYAYCANVELFIDTIDWMTDKESVAIPKRTANDVMLKVPYSDAIKWGVVAVILIPLCILITGFFVWFRRRKR